MRETYQLQDALAPTALWSHNVIQYQNQQQSHGWNIDRYTGIYIKNAAIRKLPAAHLIIQLSLVV